MIDKAYEPDKIIGLIISPQRYLCFVLRDNTGYAVFGICGYYGPFERLSIDFSNFKETGSRRRTYTRAVSFQVVIAMRDLFQVVFELKKKEIELAKQHIEQNAINAIKFHTGGMFVEPAPDTKVRIARSLAKTRVSRNGDAFFPQLSVISASVLVGFRRFRS